MKESLEKFSSFYENAKKKHDISLNKLKSTYQLKINEASISGDLTESNRLQAELDKNIQALDQKL